VKLTVSGKTLEQPLIVRMDPRVKTPLPALRQQLELSQRLAAAIDADFAVLQRVKEARKQHPDDKKLEELEGPAEEEALPRRKRKQKPALAMTNGRLAAIYGLLQSSDAAPTPQAVKAAEQVLAETAAVLKSAAAALDAR
jgi:hypothetical protein